MFNLNDSNFGGGVTVFNNGMPGKVNNVKISVVKKSAIDPDNTPDYKIVVTDEAGSQVNQGFYHFDASTAKNPKMEQWLVQRVHSIAKAVVPADHVYPEVSTSKEALDVLFKAIRDNAEDRLVNVYITYGTLQSPSKYLGLRFFNFIEAADTPANASRLKPASGDNLVKFEPDTDDALNLNGTATSTTDASPLGDELW